ncbi:MAG: M56 family metallopeptidase [Lachnospiraceae bacterium]|nr:M56 family metallopeptidase [Lachnospiraceae bacterium]
MFGILHKKIILPQGLSDTEREYILCHEEMHIRRNDHLVKWIVFLLTGIYWFQPLVWVAAHYLEQDMEMSCDEMVIRNMGDGIKKAYAQSLLSFAKGRRQEMLPLAFASGGVKWRIRNVLQTKRFRKWMIPVSVMLAVTFAVILFTERSDGRSRPDLQQTAEATLASDTPVETKTMAKNAIEKNFGKFFDFNDSNTSYETYFMQRYDQYRIDDLSQWKDETGKWCYPEKYEFLLNFHSNSDMAAQQFPPELLEDMDTEELLSFILQGKKTTLTWGWISYEYYLMGLVVHYRYYNYVHELMNRGDCAQVVHQYYKRYSQQDKERYSKMYWQKNGRMEDSLEAVNFQFVEALEWFFLALEGKGVPDEDTYGSSLERTLNNPSPPQQYIYKEDVTHDGIKDTITLDMTALYDESLATGEEETVTVTSGKTGKKIASYTADTVHYGWNGLYLYEDHGEKYLVNWKPVMYQGVGVFQLRVFSLKENGKEDVLLEKEFHFDLNPGKIHFDKKAYQEFIELVNSYLSNSYVIVDTDQGEVIYSREERQLMAPYDGSWVLEDYQELKKINTK